MTIAKDSTVGNLLPIKERAKIEGFPFNLNGYVEGTTFTADGNITILPPVPAITRAVVVDQFVVSVNKMARVQLQWSTSAFDSNRSNLIAAVLAPGVPLVIPTEAVVRFAVPPENSGSGGWPQLRLRNVYDADKTNVAMGLYANGWSITDDLDFLAPKSILWIGDSITAGGTGPTTRENQYDWRVRRYYRNKGIRARLIQMSLSGSTSPQHAARILSGWYDPIPGDLICYSLGANDAGQSISAATYRAHLESAIAWKRLTHPNAQMIVFGPTPNENNTTETGQVAIRTEGQAAVTAAADPLIKFCNLGTAYDRTLASNYASTDTAGSRVHPSDAGHAGIWSVVAPFLDAQVPTI